MLFLFDVKTQPSAPLEIFYIGNRWRFDSSHISSIKPIAQFTSHAGQEAEAYSHILDITQAKHILWVDLTTVWAKWQNIVMVLKNVRRT